MSLSHQQSLSSYRPKVRLYCNQSLMCEQKIDLDLSASHRLIHVMRYQIGDYVALFNDRDGEWLSEIIARPKKHVTCHVRHQLRSSKIQSPVHLVFAPLKPHRQAFLIEKATELGVAILSPVICEFSQMRSFNHDKVHQQTIEAAEQSERLTIPKIELLMPLIQKLDQWPTDQVLLVGAARTDAELLPRLLTNFTDTPISFLIGPEGGFSEPEMRLFDKYNFIHQFSLGANILRAETAALACLSHTISNFVDEQIIPS